MRVLEVLENELLSGDLSRDERILSFRDDTDPATRVGVVDVDLYDPAFRRAEVGANQQEVANVVNEGVCRLEVVDEADQGSGDRRLLGIVEEDEVEA